MGIRASVSTMLAAFALSVAAPAAADEMLASSLRQVAQDYTDAYDREDAEAALGTIHTNSPEYEMTRERLAAQFPSQDVKVTLVDFHYIGHCDEFAYARIKTRTAGEGPDFADNVVDAVALFHMEDGSWKFWSDHVIGVELVE